MQLQRVKPQVLQMLQRATHTKLVCYLQGHSTCHVNRSKKASVEKPAGDKLAAGVEPAAVHQIIASVQPVATMATMVP